MLSYHMVLSARFIQHSKNAVCKKDRKITMLRFDLDATTMLKTRAVYFDQYSDLSCPAWRISCSSAEENLVDERECITKKDRG